MDILFARQIEIGDTINQSQVTSHHQAKSKKPNHKSSKIFQGIKHRVSLTRFGNIYIYIYMYIPEHSFDQLFLVVLKYDLIFYAVFRISSNSTSLPRYLKKKTVALWI